MKKNVSLKICCHSRIIITQKFALEFPGQQQKNNESMLCKFFPNYLNGQSCISGVFIVAIVPARVFTRLMARDRVDNPDRIVFFRACHLFPLSSFFSLLLFYIEENTRQ